MQHAILDPLNWKRIVVGSPCVWTIAGPAGGALDWPGAPPAGQAGCGAAAAAAAATVVSYQIPVVCLMLNIIFILFKMVSGQLYFYNMFYTK